VASFQKSGSLLRASICFNSSVGFAASKIPPQLG
jgi:hypothetical protein